MQIENRETCADSILSLRHIFFSILLLLSILLLFLGGVIQIDTLFFSIVATILYCIMCLYFLKTNFSFFVISFLFLFGQFTAICSNILIESGAYMAEINHYGYVTGATARLVFLNVLFFYSAYIIYSKSFKNIHYKFIDLSKILVVLIHFVMVSYYIICGYVLLHYGSPLIKHMDRFLYHSSIPYTFFLISNLFLTLAFMQGVIAVYYLKNRDYRKIRYCFINLILLIVYRIFFGDKWSGLFFCCVLFFVPILVWMYHRAFRFRKQIFIICLISFLSLGITASLLITYYYNVNGVRSSQLVPKIKGRLAEQGQVWWAVDEIIMRSATVYPMDSLSHNEKMGQYRLMKALTNDQLVKRYKNLGVTFTMGFPAIFLYEYGYLGTGLLVVVCGMLMGCLLCWMVTAILNCDIILSFLLIRIYLMLLNGFSMGNIYRFGDWKFLVTVLLLVMYMLVLFNSKPLRNS